ncbi:MAG: hypothetical protein K0U76_05180 [Actinomycetia bacterium]|nr:hypothetical protein [Actinomycetes bacterium]MCH9700768.1 hypothetical protein [Actinomycetes bacterium]MCH9760312.1 hypothetical protein [Actinomycetes bacterium]
MTALQDWLGTSPATPYSIKAMIRGAWRGLISEESVPAQRPQLMARGIERC